MPAQRPFLARLTPRAVTLVVALCALVPAGVVGAAAGAVVLEDWSASWHRFHVASGRFEGTWECKDAERGVLAEILGDGSTLTLVLDDRSGLVEGSWSPSDRRFPTGRLGAGRLLAGGLVRPFELVSEGRRCVLRVPDPGGDSQVLVPVLTVTSSDRSHDVLHLGLQGTDGAICFRRVGSE